MSHASNFRRVTGLSEMQYALLLSMKDGEIQRRNVGSLNSMHWLTRRGIVDYVQNKTGDWDDDVWRLTPWGRSLLEAAGASRS